jgi:hypothetical protein
LSGGLIGASSFAGKLGGRPQGALPQVITVAPARGDSWRSSREGRDWQTYGVTGVTTVIGSSRVRTPAGRFTAVELRSTLHQAGYPFGSGTSGQDERARPRDPGGAVTSALPRFPQGRPGLAEPSRSP